MARFDSRLITPPREEEEIYPYRRAWRSVIVESAVLFGVAAVLFVLIGLLGVSLPPALYRPANVGLALLPLALWLLFSWWPERLVPQPRQRLIPVVLVSALAANAVGYPLVTQFFRVEEWLPLESAVNRIVGYTFTVGITQELLKYLVMRYLVWPDYFRTWLDGVAYSAAAALGYTLVLNLHFVLNSAVAPDVAAIRIFGIYALQMATSLLTGYGLADLRFSGRSLLLLPLVLAAASLLAGAAIPVRAGLVNAGLSLDSLELSATQPLLGFIFSGGVLVGLIFVSTFFFQSAERRQRESQEAVEG
ncbi:MAG: PrsW family intramembrane metalloprotease [Chloroflexi bacterium]|nr:PrsW family intramembrane metalloprotease [Chloroflexota bacterium]